MRSSEKTLGSDRRWICAGLLCLAVCFVRAQAYIGYVYPAGESGGPRFR
jgi:hypothetical protein